MLVSICSSRNICIDTENPVYNLFRRELLKRLLLSQNKRHLREGHPRLISYAFDHITAKVHVDGRFEDPDLCALEQLVFPNLAPDTVCLDIGANIGNHAVAFANHFAKVHAFEPNPNLSPVLRINARLRPNIQAWDIGCSSRTAEIEVSENPENLGATGIGRKATRPDAAVVTFKVAPLDTLNVLAPGERLSFVKIDVEGHEPDVIEGAKSTLSAHMPLIAMEVDRATVKADTNPALEALRKLGYAYFYEIRKPTIWERLLQRDTPLRLYAVSKLQRRNYRLFLVAAEPLAP